MNDDQSNSGASYGAGSVPQSHEALGQASILLIESLIHGLIARAAITVEEAIEIVETASEVSDELSYERSQSLPRVSTSTAILQAISDSLKRDCE